MGLQEANSVWQALEHSFTDLVARKYPGCDKWHWLRAVAHVNGENVRRNDDTSRDSDLAGDTELRHAWEHYIAALHAFYVMRDGPRGFLGGRGA